MATAELEEETQEETFVESVEEKKEEQQEEKKGQQQQEEKKDDPNAELRSAMADLAGTVKDLAKPKEEKTELTEEQKNELWAVYDPEKTQKDFMRKFFRMNPEATEDEVKEARGLFGDIQKGFVRQAVVSSRNIMDVELDKMREEFEGVVKPLREFYETTRARETQERFNEVYPGLDDPKFEKIVKAQAKLIADEKFKTEDEYFKALAEGAAETIKGVIPEFDLAKPAKTAATSPKLPRSRVGGSGGLGEGKTKPEEKKGKVEDDADTLDWMK